MSRLLVACIDRFGPIDDEVRAALLSCAQAVTQFAADEPMVGLGARSNLRVLARGLAVREHLMADGRRQIVGFATPGDLLDLGGLFAGMDHQVRALTRCEVKSTSTQDVTRLIRATPSLMAALCRAALTEGRLQRNWIVGLGRRSARSRTANLFCEIYARHEAVALAADGRCRFPASQADIADALGLSIVHTNRVLQTLKKDGLASLRAGDLVIADWSKLAALAQFDPTTLRPVRALVQNHDAITPRSAATANAAEPLALDLMAASPPGCRQRRVQT